jgi:hypothetical protein
MHVGLAKLEWFQRNVRIEQIDSLKGFHLARFILYEGHMLLRVT